MLGMKVRQLVYLLSAPSASEYALAVSGKEGIEDRTEMNLVNLLRVIYLTIMNALNNEEAIHKLLKDQVKEGEEGYLTCLLLWSLTQHLRLN
jgi:hypothetical protein